MPVPYMSKALGVPQTLFTLAEALPRLNLLGDVLNRPLECESARLERLWSFEQ
jgi:hypothetical protein